MDEKRIISRINGRNMAAEIASLLDDADFANRDYMESFVEELKRASGHWVEADAAVEKAAPIARLGHTLMPFGEHKGKSFDFVPLSYLDWLCRSQEEFYRALRSYLTHPELESRRSAEIGEPI